MLELAFEFLAWLLKLVHQAKLPDCCSILREMQSGVRPRLDNDGYVLTSRLIFAAAGLRAFATVSIVTLFAWSLHHAELRGAHPLEVNWHKTYVLAEHYVQRTDAGLALDTVAIAHPDVKPVLSEVAFCEDLAWSFATTFFACITFFFFLRWLANSLLSLGERMTTSSSDPPAPTAPLPPAVLSGVAGVVQG